MLPIWHIGCYYAFAGDWEILNTFVFNSLKVLKYLPLKNMGHSVSISLAFLYCGCHYQKYNVDVLGYIFGFVCILLAWDLWEIYCRTSFVDINWGKKCWTWLRSISVILVDISCYSDVFALCHRICYAKSLKCYIFCRLMATFTMRRRNIIKRLSGSYWTENILR